ncbi:glycosyltransferase [Corynebacterium callunae]|uniref:glycosyltransferase n=1 Tax=Corynebacterium callunae TaxID=1721 RepID=UPI001FFE9ACB|nr:glycosyltransferase [Corynebacterium callunae]
MHIVFLASAINVHTIRWANKLIEMGNDITVISCKDHCPEDARKLGIHSSVNIISLPFPSLGGLGYFLNAIACRKILSKLRPDVVNSHYASGYGTLGRVANARPHALSVWGSDVFIFPDKSRLHKQLLVSNLKHADIIMSTSFIMADRVREILGNSKLEIPITPFGVDIQNFSFQDQSTRDESPVRIGIIKSLKSIYGIQHLIEAAPLVREILKDRDEVNFQIHIYGDGPYRGELEALVEQNDLKELVFFHGMIQNQFVPSVLDSLDIYALPSIHESFGVAAVEAMAAGLPVVASNAPGLLEVITDGVNGIRVESGNSIQLADALVKLIMDPDLRRELGTQGRKEVENRFVFDENAKTLLTALETIAKK